MIKIFTRYMFLRCSFEGNAFNCSELFKSIVTDEGQCCTFNTQPPTVMFKNVEPEVSWVISSFRTIFVTILYKLAHNPAVVQDAEAEEEMTRWEHWDFEDGFERGINLTSNELGRYSVL